MSMFVLAHAKGRVRRAGNQGMRRFVRGVGSREILPTNMSGMHLFFVFVSRVRAPMREDRRDKNGEEH